MHKRRTFCICLFLCICFMFVRSPFGDFASLCGHYEFLLVCFMSLWLFLYLYVGILYLFAVILHLFVATLCFFSFQSIHIHYWQNHISILKSPFLFSVPCCYLVKLIICFSFVWKQDYSRLGDIVRACTISMSRLFILILGISVSLNVGVMPSMLPFAPGVAWRFNELVESVAFWVEIINAVWVSRTPLSGRKRKFCRK